MVQFLRKRKGEVASSGKLPHTRKPPKRPYQPAMRSLSIFTVAAFLALSTVGCERWLTPDPGEGTELPAPQTVDTSNIDKPVNDPDPPPDSIEALYYLVFDGETEIAAEAKNNGPRPILQQLLRQGFVIENAWYPLMRSIEKHCGAPNVFLALVVELREENESIRGFGFIANPREHEPPIFPNCGVEEFEHYSFEIGDAG